VTTPLRLDELDELDELVPDVEPPIVPPDEAPEPPEGCEPPDCEGDGEGTGDLVGDGVGVGVSVGVGVTEGDGEGEGLPEASLARGTAVVSGAVTVRAAYVVVASATISSPAEATLTPDDTLEVVGVADAELDELEDESLLAAPPPRATDVVPFSELSVKSASTVCEIVPVVALEVR
jgi:hypothetical protein